MPENNYDVFLSYHWRDHAYVEGIARALRDRNLHVFLDRWYLHPGRPWTQELETVMRGCRAVAVCIGPGEMGPWQQREVNMALERQARELEFPVIPVLLPGADPVLGFLGQNTWIDLRARPDDSNLIAILSGAIRGEATASDATESIQQTVATICPYRGLLYFREEDAPFFFGRDAAIKQLVEAVTQNQFVAVVGASGCGKSSVARAGLIPALRRDAKTVWEIVTLVPGDRPLHTLAAILLPLLEPEMTETDRMAETNKLVRALETGDVHLRDVVERILAKQKGTDRLLLVTDQWEELYTLTPEEVTRRRFIDALLEASSHVPLSLVLTLRGDFVGHALAYRPLSDRLQGVQINLGPMNRAELAAAMRQPAEKVGLSFESGLLERILDDAGDEPGNLPLVEFVLKQLWENRSRGQLLHAAYDAMGRLPGAVANKANEIFDKLSPLEQQAVQRIFLQLAAPAEEGDYTRRRANLAEISPASMQVLKRLIDERLLVTSPGSSDGEETVEVSHEALIRNWDKLKVWLNEDREFLLWRRRFGEFLGAWLQDRQKEKGGTRLSGTFLVEAEKWLIERGERLSNEEREYITASTNHRHIEENKARRRTQIFLILITAFALAAGIFGFVSRRDANTSLALQMAAQSGQKANTQLADALLLGAAAGEQQWRYETKDNLLRLMRLLPSELVGYMWGHSAVVFTVIFSPNGQTLATGSFDGMVILWDVASRKPLGEPLKAHSDGVQSVAFSPDGKTLATGNFDGTVVLWDIASRKPIGEPLKAHTSSVSSVAFSPDGKTLASGSDDRTVALWDVASRKPLGEPLKAHTSSVSSVAFSPDGKTLASGSDDRTVALWDVASRKPLGEPLKAHTSLVSNVAFSPNGKTLASGSYDDTVILWDVASRKPLGEPLKAHTSLVSSVAFSPDGKTLASGSYDDTVILWDVASRKPLGEPLKAHTNSVSSVAFSPDAKTLATGSYDRTVILWDVASRKPLGEPLKAHASSVSSVAFSPDGKTLATGSYDRTVILWDVASRKPLGEPLKAHASSVSSVAFSPNGKTLATGSHDEMVILWDVASRKPLGEPLKAHSDGVQSVAFSPDGKTLATGRYDNTVILWDVASRKPLGDPLKAHAGFVTSVAFSPDGKTLATGSYDGTVILWDVASRKPLGDPLKAHTSSVSSVAFSPDGKTLATGSYDRTVILWDVASRKPLGEPLKAHSSSVSSVAFSPDGKTLATGGFANTVVLWDVASRKPLGDPLKAHTSSVSSVAFSPDGKTLATGSHDKTVIVWNIDMAAESLNKRICEIVNRNFSKDEWREYAAGRAYRKACTKLPGPDDPDWPFASAGRK